MKLHTVFLTADLVTITAIFATLAMTRDTLWALAPLALWAVFHLGIMIRRKTG